MATPKVLLKRSSVAGRVPAAGDLQYGELAINFEDGKIYYKTASNQIAAFVDFHEDKTRRRKGTVRH